MTKRDRIKAIIALGEMVILSLLATGMLYGIGVEQGLLSW